MDVERNSEGLRVGRLVYRVKAWRVPNEDSADLPILLRRAAVADRYVRVGGFLLPMGETDKPLTYTCPRREWP